MRRMFRWRSLWYALALLLLLTFPYGPLFPWSPVKPGYEKHSFERADVFSPSGAPLPEAYRHVDEFVREAEQFHRLKMPKRITVVACRNWEDFERFMPQYRTRVVGAVTLATGAVIYVTPNIAEKHFDTCEFLRHELSHAALHQNQTVWNSLAMDRQPWFLEGLAVSFGRQKAYGTWDDFLERARREELGRVIDPQGRAAGKDLDMPFAYLTWRYFIEYLMQVRGRDAFQSYMEADLSSPREYRALFQSAYRESFSDAIADFQKAVRDGAWRPTGIQ